MPRKSTSRKNPVQRALVELRRRMGVSQQALSNRMGLSLKSIAVWETSDSPQNVALAMLYKLATEEKHADLAQVFMGALESLKAKQRGKVDDIVDEINRWHAINDHLKALGAEADRLRNEKLKDTELPQRIVDRLYAFEKVLAAVQNWSWRSR